MFRSGNYVVSEYFYEGQKWFRVEFHKNPERHTHIHLERGFKAAKMCAVRANQGRIPEHYPDWMIQSINRLWFGPDYDSRKDICTKNLLTNDPDIRVIGRSIKKERRKRKRLNKGYFDKHCFIASPQRA